VPILELRMGFFVLCLLGSESENKMELEEAAREIQLAQQEIFRQTLEERDEEILTLQKKVEALESLLARITPLQAAYPRPQLQALPLRPAPRRWSVR